MSVPAPRREDVVVCGFDGSPAARAALGAALDAAAERGARLRVVTAFAPPEQWVGWTIAPIAATLPPLRDVGEAVTRDVGDQLGALVAERGAEPPVTPEIRVVDGSPVAALVAEARNAVELVVGRRGRGALRSALLGSVALGCVLAAPCPVTVVSGVAAPGRPRAGAAPERAGARS